jgi:hypothetical protein
MDAPPATAPRDPALSVTFGAQGGFSGSFDVPVCQVDTAMTTGSGACTP